MFNELIYEILCDLIGLSLNFMELAGVVLIPFLRGFL